MKRILVPCLTILLVAATSCTRDFTFVQMADTQIGFGDPSPALIHSDTLMQKAVHAVNALHPEVAVICGDLVNQPWGEGDDRLFAFQDSIFQANLHRFDPVIDVRLVPGNHDIHPYTQEKHDAYVQRRGYDRFSFKKFGCAFIGFDTNCIKDGAVAEETQQWAWLSKELEKASRARFTFLFIHCPVIRETMDEPEDYFNFSKDARAKYLDLFKRNGVDAVFAGHTHRPFACEVDGIRLYTAGAVGNCLGAGIPGYHVIHVGKDGFTVTYTPTPGVDSSTAQL